MYKIVKEPVNKCLTLKSYGDNYNRFATEVEIITVQQIQR